MIRPSCSHKPARGAAHLCCVLVWLSLGWSTEAVEPVTNAADANALEIRMTEVSVFELPREIGTRFLRGRTVRCTDSRTPSITYPQDLGAKAAYGAVRIPDALGDQGTRGGFCFALAATGARYDRLYFDCDGDGDLSEETPVGPREAVPSTALRGYADGVQETYFDSVEVTFDFGPGGKRAVELIGHLIVRQERTQMSFMAARVRRGEFRIDDIPCQVYLGHMYSAGGRFDEPGTGLVLVRSGTPQLWAGGYTVTATHEIGGRFFRFASNPLGDTLTATAHDGPFGTFELGKGSRDVKNLSMTGSLQSEQTAVAVAYASNGTNPEPISRCQLPVGDYYPILLTVRLDDFQALISNNYHRDNRGRTRADRGPVYGFKIDEDQPFVLDFSAKPKVVFTEPATDARIQRGQTLRVEAVLIDPTLDIMIRRLYDTSGGRPVSLEPKVVISRADGEIVAEGVMPFG